MKCAVDGQAKAALGTARARLLCCGLCCGFAPAVCGLADSSATPWPVWPTPGTRGCSQCRGASRRGNFALHGGQPRGIDAIDFGERHRAVRQASKSTMARCSRVWGMGPSSGNHQQHVSRCRWPGQHVVHQALMAGNIHKAQLTIVAVGIAQVERDAALSLLSGGRSPPRSTP